MAAGAEFWSNHVAAAEHSGQAVSAYARQHGLPVTALYYWRRKLKAANAPTGSVARFVTLSVPHGSTLPQPSGCTLILAGVRLEMAALPSPEWLMAVALAAQGTR